MIIDLQPNEPLSRYVDLGKLLDFLQTKHLYLPAICALDDPLEGSLSLWEAAGRDLQLFALRDSGTPPTVPELSKPPRSVKQLRRHVFASCWFTGDYESLAMWAQYGGGAGVCLRTTVMHLEACMESARVKFALARCYYRDTENPTRREPGRIKGNSPGLPGLNHFFRKHVAYSWEDEARLVVHCSQQADPRCYMPSKAIGAVAGKGCSLDVDPQHLLTRIVLPPGASTMLATVVKRVLTDLDYSIPVVASRVPRSGRF